MKVKQKQKQAISKHKHLQTAASGNREFMGKGWHRIGEHQNKKIIRYYFLEIVQSRKRVKEEGEGKMLFYH